LNWWFSIKNENSSEKSNFENGMKFNDLFYESFEIDDEVEMLNERIKLSLLKCLKRYFRDKYLISIE
jgi:hypothetical protein